jgi:SAM-dependent methyltransferase
MPTGQALFQSEHHPLVAERFATLEEYCLSLLHLKAYETAAELARGKVILDLGCNNGYGTELIARGAARVTGADVSARSIEAAQRRCPGLDFTLIDGATLPWADASFDAVFSFQVIEHIEDPSSYLQEIHRVLKPGGVAMFTTPNGEMRLAPGMKPWNEFHVREYSGRELADLLGKTFPRVDLSGLSASPKLHRVEYRRVTRARRMAQGAARSKALGSIIAPLKLARRRLLAAAGKLSIVRDLRERRFRRFSTRDFFYEEGLRPGALDLMALCHR